MIWYLVEKTTKYPSLATRSFSSLYRIVVWRLAQLLYDFNGLKPLHCWHCFGSLSGWKSHPRPVFSVLAEGKRFLSNMIPRPVHWALSVVKLTCTLNRKTALKRNISTSELDCEDGVLWIYSTFLFFQTLQFKSMPKRWNFGVIWPQHFFPNLLWVI